MIETFYDLEEVVDAVEAVRSVSSLPIVALMTFDEGAETLAGITTAGPSQRLAELDVAAAPWARTTAQACLAALHALDEMGKDGSRSQPSPTSVCSLAGGR